MLYVITPISDNYTKFLTELRINLRTMVQVPYTFVIADNTTGGIEPQNDNEIVVHMGGNVGIFAAKYRAFLFLREMCNLTGKDWVTFIDADDYYKSAITPDLLYEVADVKTAVNFDLYGRNIKTIADCRQCFTWNFFFRPDLLYSAYMAIVVAREKSSVDKSLGIKINSCEDMLLIATIRETEIKHIARDLVCHTDNDTSATNSTHYTFEKIRNLFGDWSDLVDIACHLERGRQFLLSTMNNCFGQYWCNYRQWLPYEEREACDEYVKNLQKY